MSGGNFIRACTLLFVVCCLTSDRWFAVASYPTADQLLAEAEGLQDWLVSKRRDLHKTPELGFAQLNTCRKIRLVLEENLIPYKFPFAKTGIVATVGKGAPYVSLHVPMDALPIKEPQDCLFRSETEGVFYANGNDALMAMMLGAIRLVKAHESELRGTVQFVFQPGGEAFGGAKRVIADGAIKEANAIFGLRVDPLVPAGVYASRAGIVTPASYSFSVTVRGKGRYAAEPDNYKSPMSAAASMILGLQALSVAISYINVTEPHSLHVIPDEYQFGGTLRGHVHDQVKGMKKVLVDTVNKMADTYDSTAEVVWHDDHRPHSPPTTNEPALVDMSMAVAKNMNLAAEKAEQNWKTDDFSRFCQAIPCALGWLGIGQQDVKGKKNNDINTARFKFDEQQLSRGAAINAAFALHYLHQATTKGALPTAKAPEPEDLDQDEYDVETGEQTGGHDEL